MATVFVVVVEEHNPAAGIPGTIAEGVGALHNNHLARVVALASDEYCCRFLEYGKWPTLGRVILLLLSAAVVVLIRHGVGGYERATSV